MPGRKRTLVILTEIEIEVGEHETMAEHVAAEWLLWELRGAEAPATEDLELDPGTIEARHVRVFDVRGK